MNFLGSSDLSGYVDGRWLDCQLGDREIVSRAVRTGKILIMPYLYPMGVSLIPTLGKK